MGAITIEQIISADGFAAKSDGGIGFFGAADAVDATESSGPVSEQDSEQLHWLESVDGIILGRRTYEMFARFWPMAGPAENPVAGPINSLPKYVVSRSHSLSGWSPLMHILPIRWNYPRSSSAIPRPASRPENMQPPRNVPSNER